MERGSQRDDVAQSTRIVSEVNLEENGKQIGFLRVPHSVHESAYGYIPVPIACLQNGSGPRVLLVAGNHGDEYEGQIALSRLCQSLELRDVNGRLVILTAANVPAAIAGRRTSPIEVPGLGNLNRSFPGDPNGSPTSMIAHYIDSVLLPQSDYVLDLHSGGTSLMYVPSAETRRTVDPRKFEAALGLLRMFGAPISYIARLTTRLNLAAAAVNRGVVYMGTELGGGGTVSERPLRLAEDGIRRVLRHVGMLPSDYRVTEPCVTRVMEVGGSDYYVHAPQDGVFEPYAELGAEIAGGDTAGFVHCPEDPRRTPAEVHFARSGFVLCTRPLARVRRGDCLYHLATDCAGEVNN